MTSTPMPHRPDSPVCLITGGSSGIGLSTAKYFASQGYQVAICGRSEQRLADAFSILAGETSEQNILTTSVDLNEIQQAKELVNQVVERFGKLDALVNNAALAPLSPVENVKEEDFEAITNVNIRSVFYLTQSAWSVMANQKQGVIVNVSSMAAVDPFPGFSLYGASKAWLELWTKALAVEGADKGIRVYAVRPGAVETPLLRGLFPDFPPEQCVHPDEIASIIWNCVSQPDQHASGESIPVTKQPG